MGNFDLRIIWPVRCSSLNPQQFIDIRLDQFGVAFIGSLLQIVRIRTIFSFYQAEMGIGS